MLYTTPKAWINTSTQKFACLRCKRRGDIPIGSLFIKAATGVPACPRGCTHSKPHSAKECNRERPDGEATAVNDEDVVLSPAGRLFKTSVFSENKVGKFARVTVQDNDGFIPDIAVGVFIPPSASPGQQLAPVHTIRYEPPLQPPKHTSIKKIVVTSKARFGSSTVLQHGLPAEPFLGLEKREWAEIAASPCATKRYAALFGEASPEPQVESAIQSKISPAFKLKGAAGASQVRPAYLESNGVIKCGFCCTEFKGDWSHTRYHQICAPDAAMAQHTLKPRKQKKRKPPYFESPTIN